MNDSLKLPLVCHPVTPAPAVSQFVVEVSQVSAEKLRLTYRLQGDLSGLRVPAPVASRRADGLWTHTCFEAFVRSAGQAGYLELNFAPSGEWAAYRFLAYREADPARGDPSAPAIQVRLASESLELEAILHRRELPPGDRLQIGLSAVIEAADGSLSYWALRHPSDKPDFHHPESFVLALAMDGAPQT